MIIEKWFTAFKVHPLNVTKTLGLVKNPAYIRKPHYALRFGRAIDEAVVAFEVALVGLEKVYSLYYHDLLRKTCGI